MEGTAKGILDMGCGNSYVSTAYFDDVMNRQTPKRKSMIILYFLWVQIITKAALK
jgi:hypothetical protein